MLASLQSLCNQGEQRLACLEQPSARINIHQDTRSHELTLQNNLSGKTALVTGASRGIGRATALALAQAGAQVIVHYGSGEKEATAVVSDIRNVGGKAEKVTADLRTADGPHRLAERVRAIMGDRLDILVANAGISKAASVAETTVEDFDALFAVNVRAPYFLVQQLLPVMCKGSSVILLSSLAAHAVVGNLSAYSATKGAIDTLVKHFAAALGERGIRVNAVAPGVVPTEMSNFAKTAEGRDFTVKMQALKRLAAAEDIAAAIAFLASDQAQWITGDTLRVDGGSKL
jgi:3-oxoacyl-[acyl-carrier protein] reductase